MSKPNTLAVPPVLLTSEVTMPIRVVLPAPFGTQQREEVAFLDVQVDAAQRVHAVLVGLGRVAGRQGKHGSPLLETEHVSTAGRLARKRAEQALRAGER